MTVHDPLVGQLPSQLNTGPINAISKMIEFGSCKVPPFRKSSYCPYLDLTGQLITAL